MKLSGFYTIVTGGSQGFGRHIVEAFLAAGANVVFCARTAADVERTRAELADESVRFVTLTGFPYVIVYNAERRPPLILRVLHGARDLPEAMKEP